MAIMPNAFSFFFSACSCAARSGKTSSKTKIPGVVLLDGKVLVVSNDRLEERQIKTGLANWEYTEVLEGLQAGERIVTSLERAGVKAGAKVTLEEKK